MRAASDSEKSCTSCCRRWRAAAENAGNSGRPASDRATSHATSTSTRCAMKPASDSRPRSASPREA
ncbi:hypothetical protein D3C81_1597350 [compost metagenome]